MLNLTREVGQSLLIGKDVKVTVLEVRGRKVRLGIVAPREIPVRLAKKTMEQDQPDDGQR